MAGDSLDDSYHEYLWGEASPRAFARRARIAGAKEKRNSVKTIDVQVGVDVDLAGIVSR